MFNWWQWFFGGGHGGGSNSVPEFDGTSSIAVAALLVSLALVFRARAKQ
jgi:hypothetical protein